jgi:hypothetical protein
MLEHVLLGVFKVELTKRVNAVCLYDGKDRRFVKECLEDRFTDQCSCSCIDDGSPSGFSGAISYHLKIGDRYITETYTCNRQLCPTPTPTPTPTPSPTPTPPDGGGECPCGDCVYGCCGNGLNELDPGCGCDGDECCGRGTHTECTGGECEPPVEICAYDPYTWQILGCETFPGECEPEFCVEVCN